MSQMRNTGNGTEQKVPDTKANQPPNPEGTEKGTKDNNLSTGHSKPGDGGDDNAK